MIKKYVVTGMPGSGKSSLIEKLMRQYGFYVMASVPKCHKSEIKELKSKKDLLNFQSKIFDNQSLWEREIPTCRTEAIINKGIIDTLAYLDELNAKNSSLYKRIVETASEDKNRYSQVFLLHSVKKGLISTPFVEITEEKLIESYMRFGYSPIQIEGKSLEDKARFVKEAIEKTN